MALDDILKVLELAIYDRFDEIQESLLRKKQIRNVLTAYFTERQVRPDLVSLITIPELMEDYLSLSLEEREELERFRNKFPEYLIGEGKANSINTLKNEKIRILAQKSRLTRQVINLFNFYLETRSEGDMFNASSLQINKRLREKFGNLGQRVYNNARALGEDSLQEILRLVAQERPEISEYTTMAGILKIDGPKQIIRMFDFFLENREEGEVFNINYTIKNKKLKKKLGNMGYNLYQKCKFNLKKEGGIEKIFELAAQKRPEILNYTTHSGLLKIDGPRQLLSMFDFYLKNRKEMEVFGRGYISLNKSLNSRFNNLGRRLYFQVYRTSESEGSFQKLIDLVAQERPEISEYTTMAGILKIDGPKQIIRMFDFFLENREENDVFTLNYIVKNKKLKEKFGNIGQNLYANVRNNLKEEGIQAIIALAAQERPEILNYWQYTPMNKYSFAPQNEKIEIWKNQLITMFDFYLKTRKNEDFHLGYLFNNQRLTKRFGTLGKRLYKNITNNIGRDGFRQIVQLAAGERPEILQYWSYQSRKAA